jgi:16S rRNA (cytosine1402-N4)-methyltransferase
MLVNDEVAELQALLEAIPDLLADHGIAVVLSFHSIEDRLVKEAFRRAARGCVCPPRLPACVCGRTPTLKLVSRRVMRPTAVEVAGNPRAASTRLRAVRRLPRVA